MPQKLEEKEICKFSGKLFVKYNMSRHQHFHEKNCSNCAQSFPNEANLQKHLASVHAPCLVTKKNICCRSCPLSFSSYYELLQHKRNSHQCSIPNTNEEIDFSNSGVSLVFHSELQTVRHFPQDSVVGYSRKKSQLQNKGDQPWNNHRKIGLCF